MPEYIEREKLNMEILGLTIMDSVVAAYAGAVIDRIINAPAADVAPVVHGRWIEVHSIIAEQEYSHKRKCNICKTYTWNLGEPLRYCPNCGAKMDLEGDHE